MILVIRPDQYQSAFACKPIVKLLDEQPILNPEQIQLAIWIREHFYTPFFDCLHLMLPSGVWFEKNEAYQCIQLPNQSLAPEMQAVLNLFSQVGQTLSLEEIKASTKCTNSILSSLEREGYLQYHSNIKQKTQDKTQRVFSLALPLAQAKEKISKRSSPVQFDVIALLADGSEMSQKELMYMTGVSTGILGTMVRKGILKVNYIEQFRFPDFSHIQPIPLPELNTEQQEAFEGICALLHAPKAQGALLFGVTGSGKTEVYRKLIAQTLSLGQSAIVLVPEIALTPQLIELFIGTFGQTVAVLHSALSAGERYDSWKKIRSGNAQVVIGTRSAIFAPVHNLGLIIIDEEHDSAYKSEQAPRYHAREIAKRRAQQNQALLLLASATPSIETYYAASQGKLALFSLSERYHGSALPQVILANQRGEIRSGWNYTIGQTLHDALYHNLLRREQSILFLNRRGNSRTIGCTMCGWIPQCPHCSTSLTYHSVNHRAICHFCGASVEVSNQCPICYSSHLFTEGAGTQKVEQELHTLFPEARVLRLDADTTGKKNSHQKILTSFSQQKADILIGTQMVAKGLDFDRVTLVGVLDADQSLFAQDYRAHERTFSLITQVIGRAGRRNRQGMAIIQTYHPEHTVLQCAARQDYIEFYQSEIETRQALQMPPAAQILMLTASGTQESQVFNALFRLKQRMMCLMQGQFADFQFPVLGPTPATVVRVMERYRYYLIIRCPDTKRRRQLISGVMTEFSQDKKNRGVSLVVDLNPDSL